MKKWIIKTILYSLSIILPIIIEITISELHILGITYIFMSITALSVLGLILLIELIVHIAQHHGETREVLLTKIEQYGQRYVIFPKNYMFVVNPTEYALIGFTQQRNRWVRLNERLGLLRNTVYFSVSTKGYLNWIDYLYFDFLKVLKTELHCKIIIALHYNEKTVECGYYKENDKQEYYKLKVHFAKLIEKVVGQDVKIIEEEDFRVKNISGMKHYATEFHNLFVSKMLNVVQQITKGETDYNGFKRNLSYVESVFPVMMISRRHNNLFVLDHQRSQAIWSESPFDEYKKNYSFYFIKAKTITYEDGTPVGVLSEEDSINITDSISILQRKIKALDSKIKRVMFRLLSTNLDICISDLKDKDLDKALIDTIQLIRERISLVV